MTRVLPRLQHVQDAIPCQWIARNAAWPVGLQCLQSIGCAPCQLQTSQQNGSGRTARWSPVALGAPGGTLRDHALPELPHAEASLIKMHLPTVSFTTLKRRGRANGCPGKRKLVASSTTQLGT